MPDWPSSVWIRKQRFCLKCPWAPPEDLQVVCGQEWRSTWLAEVRLETLCVTECICLCCVPYHKIIDSLCSDWNRRLGEWKLFVWGFAADCLSLQSGCSPETHWAAARGLLAWQVHFSHWGLLDMFICSPDFGEHFLAFVFQSFLCYKGSLLLCTL